MKRGKLRLGIVGAMVGRNPGFVTTQGEKLTDLFREAGYPVMAVSEQPNRYLRALDIFGALLRSARQLDALVVLVYSGASFVIVDLASQVARMANIPLILSLHGGGLPVFMARFPRWTSRVLRRADLVVAQSDYLARTVAERGMRARVIPNVIQLDRYEHEPRKAVRPTLFWMRAFHDVYHPEMAVRVLAMLRPRLPDATLTMAGQDKGIEARVRSLSAQLGVADAVRFCGFLDMEGKRREAAKHDVFLNTSRIDNRPVSVVEACAWGLPVISTNVGGIRDLLEHERTGLLVDDGDVNGMADAIVRLVHEPVLAERLSAAGRELADRSMPERVLAAWQDAFEVVAR